MREVMDLDFGECVRIWWRMGTPKASVLPDLKCKAKKEGKNSQPAVLFLFIEESCPVFKNG